MEAAAGTTRAESQLTPRFSLREASRILEVPEGRLRALARAGFLAPQRGPIGPLSFGFQDLLLLRTTKELVESGVPIRRIRGTWASLRAHLDAGMPLTSITIEADGDEVVVSDGQARWRPDSGQFVLDFDAGGIAEHPETYGPPRIVERPAPALNLGDAPPPPVTPRPTLSVVPRVATAESTGIGVAAPAAEDHMATGEESELTAADWYEMACELEASSPLEARAAYERALELNPDLVEAHVNLGRHYHLAGLPGRAEPHYREAVRLDPDDPTPHFNIGVMLEESGRKDEAVLAYRQAILRDPDFADAHCNLGLLLESMGRKQEAMRHLMAARSGAEPG